MKWLYYLPNALTFSRLLLCPIVLFCQVSGYFGWGILLFTVAALSDFLDGFLARRYGWETELGAILDPVSDKLLALSFFSFLMIQGSCPAWFLGLLLAALLLQSLGFLLIYFGRTPIHFPLRPLPLGKWNMALQFFWIGVIFLDLLLRDRFPRNFRYSQLFHLAGYAALAVMQVSVFFRYCFRFRAYLVPDPRWLL